jgi:hypothetical protein
VALVYPHELNFKGAGSISPGQRFVAYISQGFSNVFKSIVVVMNEYM